MNGGIRLPEREPQLRSATVFLLLALLACAPPSTEAPEKRASVERIAYGTDPNQYGELRLPEGPGPFPTAVMIHGGCWLAQYGTSTIEPLSDALTETGFATWTIEYRRVGQQGGGWPGTFLDVGAAIDHLASIARQNPIDLQRVVLAGHSAGGQLALWAATRAALPAGTELHTESPLIPKGVLGLAAISDLGEYGESRIGCNAAVVDLMGGTPEEVPERYAAVDPTRRLPVGVPVHLVHGDDDKIVLPQQSVDFAAGAAVAGEEVALTRLPGTDHFEVISPELTVTIAAVNDLAR